MINQLAISLDIYLDNGTYTAKQSDADSRYLLITVTDNGTATEIESNAVVNLKARKPSGALSYDHGTVIDGKALILLTSDTLAEAGTVYCELEITQVDPVALLKTLTFKLDVKSEVYSQTIPESTSTFTALTEALAAAGSIGKVSDLKTEDKSTLVAGVNEIHDEVVDLQNTKEDKSNKVTSIDSESTDTQYPSAKLLYDQLATKEDNLPITPLIPAEKFLNGNRSWAVPAHNKITDLNADANYQHITTTQVSKLTNIEENAEVNIIETVSIDGADITPDANRNIDIPLATSTNDGAMSSEYAEKLDGIAENANNYTHPASHSPSIITQDVNNRFVTDTEKSTWNGKQDSLGFTPVPNTRKVNDKALSSDITLTQDDVGDGTTNKVFTSTEKSKLSGIAENANLYVHPNHTGDVTSDGDGATTIANDTVSNTKLSNMPTMTLKGNNTGATADPIDLTVSQTKAMLDIDDLETSVSAHLASPLPHKMLVDGVVYNYGLSQADGFVKFIYEEEVE